MSFLSEIISGGLSGIIAPLSNVVTTIFTKKEDTKLEMFKVDGQVDLGLISAHVAIIEAKASLLKNKWLVWLQVGFGIPLMIFYGKCLLWDKVLGWGTTDALGGAIETYSYMIVSFLFLHSAITSWGRKT